jgi:adenosylcobinamide-phosphate synthase
VALDPAETAGVLVAALAFDRVLGEPPAPFHPVVWIGALAGALLRRAPGRGATAQLAYGAAVALLVPALAAGGAWLALRTAARVPGLELVVAVLLLKPTFAVRALGEAARRVGAAVARGDLDAARHGLASLCSRDPRPLGAPKLVAASVESVAENASDSVIAPLFYFVLFGVPAAVAYRAINTLDSMVGYRGPTEYLGKAAARFDDLANLVPARLTAALLLAGGALVGADVRSGWAILRRDGARTESPNAGRPMAAMAGLLGVELAKAGHYRLGDARAELEPAQIDRAWRVVGAAGALGLVLAAAALGVRHAVS